MSIFELKTDDTFSKCLILDFLKPRLSSFKKLLISGSKEKNQKPVNPLKNLALHFLQRTAFSVAFHVVRMLKWSSMKLLENIHVLRIKKGGWGGKKMVICLLFITSSKIYVF